MVIKDFSNNSTSDFFYLGKVPKNAGWASLKSIAKRKLDMIHYAVELNDLRSPPGNCLEQLHGNFVGYHSIRINNRWRIIFRWTVQGARDVQIIDYH